MVSARTYVCNHYLKVNQLLHNRKLSMSVNIKYFLMLLFWFVNKILIVQLKNLLTTYMMTPDLFENS
ncbi:hypothetical protein T06_5745 [Trichinella sp. T6]|nr:hypothetical protein T06_5745 [Trichinella sp. T6]